MPPGTVYRPDRWVLLQLDLTYPDTDTFTCLLSGWDGGYAQSDEWRRSSAITDRQYDDGWWTFTTDTGSQYKVRASSYGFTGLTRQIFTEMTVLATAHGNTVTLLEAPTI